jgi:hypothetical protein
MDAWQLATLKYERMIQHETKEFSQVAMTRLLAEAMWNNPQDLKFIRDVHWILAVRKPLTRADRDRIADLHEDVIVRLNTMYEEDFDTIMGMDCDALFGFFGVSCSEFELAQAVLEDSQKKDQMGIMACVVTDVILDAARLVKKLK